MKDDDHMAGQGHNMGVDWEKLAHHYRAQRDQLANLLRDTRLEERHRLIGCELTMRMNPETGTAYPGLQTLANDASRWLRKLDKEGQRSPYGMNSVNKTMSQLMAFEHFSSFRAKPPGMKRPLANYRMGLMSTEQLQNEITKALGLMKKSDWTGPAQHLLPLDGIERGKRAKVASDLPKGGNMPPLGNVPEGGQVTHEQASERQLELHASPAPSPSSDLPPLVPTVNTKEESSSSSDAPQAARRRRELFDPGIASKLEALALRHGPNLHTPEEAWDILDGMAATFGVALVEDAYWATESRGKLARPWSYFVKVMSDQRAKRAAEERRVDQQGQRPNGRFDASQSAPQAPPEPRPVLSERERLIQAMRACYPAGQIGQWNGRALGPRPGKPDCALPQADQNAVWRETLKRFGASITGWQVMPLNVLGVCIHHRIVNAWKINPVSTPDFPIPADILTEFHIPRTEADLVAAKSALRLWEAKGAADRAQKSNTSASSTA